MSQFVAKLVFLYSLVDQFVDCGDQAICAGHEVVLLGGQREERISAGELAGLAGTIAYEIVCRVGARVPRRYVDG